MDKEELRRQMIEKAKKEIHEAYASEEYALIQAINASIDLTRSYNLLNERLSEWNGLYFPEAKANTLKAAELAVSIASNSIESNTGRKISSEESQVLMAYAALVKGMQEAINSLDSYIANAAKRIMPNATYLTDPKIASELLSKAGSLKRLATMPASTIQLLGAEKALFKHIKFGSKPPKYGVLYKLADISSAEKWQRGRIARAYASKLAIALHADYFSKNFIAGKLKEQLDAIIANVKQMQHEHKSPELSMHGSKQHMQQGSSNASNANAAPYEKRHSGNNANTEQMGSFANHGNERGPSNAMHKKAHGSANANSNTQHFWERKMKKGRHMHRKA